MIRMNSDKILAAYYFRAGMFTLVPDHIRESLDEMKSWGTDVICIATTEHDLNYNEDNVDFLCEETHKRGMKVYTVPSMLAGVTAGAPLTASSFGYFHPETSIKDKNGNVTIRRCGPLGSFYHPKVKDFFINKTSEMIQRWDVDGIIWDEPKWTYWQDFSEMATQNNPKNDFRKYMQDYAVFYGEVNAALKAKHEGLTIVHFDEACRNDIVVEESAKIKNIDFYGVDGRPWPCRDASREGNRKTIPDYGERYFTEARKNNVKTFALIENQRVSNDEEEHLMYETLPKIIEMPIDFLTYYYWGFHQPNNKKKMEAIKKNVMAYKGLS